MSSTTAARSTPVRKYSLESYATIPRLALDWVRGVEATSKFLRRMSLASLDPPGVARGADGLAGAMGSANARWGNDVAAALASWNRGETVTLIAGQQVGFAGGPLYTLAKIASLIAIRRELAARNKKATIFFWLATEDHDVSEVSSVTLQTGGEIRTLRARPQLTRHPVGTLEVPDDLRRAFLDTIGIDEPEWLRAGITFRDSFALLLADVLRGEEIVLVDSLLPELRRAGSELFLRLFESYDEAGDHLRSRTRELSDLGYGPQVESRDDLFTLLYLIDDRNERVTIERREGLWYAGENAISWEDLSGLASDSPERISTAALVRPLLQDLVLRPDVFVGGPAEVAYYAQSTVLHDRFDVPQPAVALRAHLLVAPSRMLRALERYSIDPAELRLGVDELLARRDDAPQRELSEKIETMKTHFEQDVAGLRTQISGIDPSLDRSIERSLRRMRYQLGRVADRGRRALARRDKERHDAVLRLANTLYPGGIPQDRVVAWIGYWLQHRESLLPFLVSAAEPDRDVVNIVSL